MNISLGGAEEMAYEAVAPVPSYMSWHIIDPVTKQTISTGSQTTYVNRSTPNPSTPASAEGGGSYEKETSFPIAPILGVVMFAFIGYKAFQLYLKRK